MISAFASASSFRRQSVVIGAIGLGLSVLGFLVDRTQFFAAYLEAYIFVLAFPLGAMGLLMIHSLTQGSWGWTIRPFLVAGVRTLPWMVVFFIPIVLGMHVLYPWSNPDYIQHTPVMLTKLSYLNPQAWLIRAVIYFSLWLIFAFFLLRWLMPGPVVKSLREFHRLQRLAAGGMIVFMLTMSFAAIDWIMSIEPRWFSSLFGVIIIVGQGMTAFGFATYVAILMHRRSPNPWVSQRNLHDLGKFLFMTVMLWGYTNLSQYLIIWMGNLPEENFWFQMRYDGYWKIISFVFVMCQFTLPFFILLPSRVKKNQDAMLKVIPFVLLVRLLEQVYLIAPSFRAGQFPFHWLDLVVPLGLGGIWAALFFSSLKGGVIPEPVIVPHSLLQPQDKNMPRPH
jgi:hypothetical protein